MSRLFSRSFLSLVLAQSCFGYAFSSFFLLPKFLTRELQASPSEVGLVVAAFAATTVVCMPLVGSAVDRFGRRRFMTAGALLMGAAALGFLAVDRVGPLAYLLRMLQGVAFAMSVTAGSTLVIDEVPADRLGQALGLFGASMLGMNAIAPAISEELADRFGWSWAFIAAAVLALASALLTARVHERARDGRGEPPARLRDVMLRARSLRIGLVIALAGAAFGAMMTFSQPFALSLGDTHVRGFFVAYALTAVGLRLTIGGVADRWGRNRVSVLSLALYALVVLATSELVRGALPLLGAFLGAAHGLFYPAFNALAVEGAGPHERGKVMALFNGSFNAGTAGSTLALGFVAERYGFPAVFWIAAAGVAVGWALLVLSPEGRRSRRDESVAALSAPREGSSGREA